MTDIAGYENFTKIEPIDKGWSNDKKYCIETKTGQQLLLRVSDISQVTRRKTEFEMLKKIEALHLPTPLPIDFGICEDGKSVYQLLTWCDGQEAEQVLPQLSEVEQYALGVTAGEILRKLHSLPASETQEEWVSRFNRKTNLKIQKYRECGLQFLGDEKTIGYIEQNRHLLNYRPQCFQHGDYHVGNMVISSTSELSVIDFDRQDFGDPWEEFNRIVWSATTSPHFATGQINGYFEGEPPLEFFKLLAFYIACNTLSSIYWAIPFGQEEIDVMLNQSQRVLAWFDAMKNPVPTWYLKEYAEQYQKIVKEEELTTKIKYFAESELKSMDYAFNNLELLRYKDGVSVWRVASNDHNAVLKCFEKPEHRREIGNYRILTLLGIPTLKVFASTDSSFLMEDIEYSAFRLARAEDMTNPKVARLVAEWYQILHKAGREYAESHVLYDESDFFTRENLDVIKNKLGQDELPIWPVFENHFEHIQSSVASLPRTLTYNDFHYNNLVIARDETSAMVFDYNFLGKGYVYSDIRNVSSQFAIGGAREAFLSTYGDFDQTESTIDDVLSHFFSLYVACQREVFPNWGKESLEMLKDGRMLAAVEKLLKK